ncbi:MAG: DUF2267 domain-containing protein [Bacteriovoracaceae bacterium]
MVSNVKAIQKTVQEAAEWVHTLMEQCPLNENESFVLIRATLKAIRDRITKEEAIHFGAQLPAIFRGFYYEGFSLNSRQTKDSDAGDFLTSIRFHLGGHFEIHLQNEVPKVLKLISQRISEGEIEDVKNNLPREIQELFQ